jgi:uncharacterized membrane protein (UPF0127 family)
MHTKPCGQEKRRALFRLGKDKSLQVILLVAAMLIGSWMFCTACKKTSRTDASGDRYEVHFKKEGYLAFVKKNTFDTISVITVEIADSEEEITNGLMWRYSMPDTNGMLFIFDQERPLSFWMKNTSIPLDMVFVNGAREIVSIQDNATPLSTLPIFSRIPARYVVEVNAWFCVDHGIKTGDRITFFTVK